MKIEKTVLNALKKSEIITLEMIHDLLEVKQHINNYQRNTNKKYGLNLEKDEVINREVADMIIINTLGKLNMLAEQSYFLRLVRNENIDTPKVRKAEKFAEKANLVTEIIEMSKVLSLTDVNNSDLIEYIEDYMYQKNIQNREYFSKKGMIDWFKNRLDYLIGVYKND